MLRPVRSAALSAALRPCAAFLLAGCFDGADALHLPCERDDDCGRGQSCVAVSGTELSFCDGPPDGFDPTGSSGDLSTGAESTGASGSESESGSSGPPIPVCGNGMLEEGETCDDGEDTLACNSAPGCRGAACCVAPTCGDGYVNTAAFETCEGAARGCTDGCVAPLLFQDFQSSAGGDIFAGPPPGLTDVPPEPSEGSVAWRFDGGNQWWETGDYGTDGGAVLASTRTLELPADLPAGTEVQLRFRHFHFFDDGSEGACDPAPRGDGGMVFVFDESGSSIEQILPITSTGGLLIDASDPTCNPYSDGENERPAYVHRSDALGETEPATFSLASWQGATIRIVFVASYDCGNCWTVGSPPANLGWRIDDLEVGVHPTGARLER
jgi:hypothetical protein